MEIDRIDRSILEQLQKNGRISNVELSKLIGLSTTPCLERVRRLEQNGFILGYRAKLNPHLLQAGLLVYVEIRLSHTTAGVFEDFKDSINKMPYILECHLVSGDFDYLIKARVKDMPQYRNLLGESLLKLPGVSASRSYIVMEEVKDDSLLMVQDKIAN